MHEKGKRRKQTRGEREAIEGKRAGETRQIQTRGQKTADSRRQTADSRRQTADSRQQTADSRQQTADSRQQTADSSSSSSSSSRQ
jgi:hypothetical protein